ncbi:putative parvulin-type peptidyl-prolyl cis-trans isomerase precursor [Pseudooceanicola marinus]|uniref:Parvulin-like PPIase n=1 Tax=Pseudooceanicola marinus TaxID=396013 RepID=A0A1X7A259_9RHOB|nr:peptidylprolyl isomerase [Pseudooceanicola marinus]PJE31251.1 peptidylprolyl isomerase [Pseudooceanicola marinus]SLN68104.1 putative parvulin-type peptidyl-prolyl cis-trans isomerase precursor [Pseudooceanicola marinus]
MLHRLTLAALLALSVPAPLLAQDTAATETTAPEMETFTVEGPLALDTVLARVGETEITLGHVVAAHMEAPQPYNQMPMAQIAGPLLQQLIQQEELSQQFEGETPAATRYMLDNTERRIVATDAMMQHLNETLTDERIQAAYDEAYPDDASGPVEYHAAHILVETEEEAQAIIEQLDGGAEFAQLARDESTGPSGPNGGDLGWFTPDRMVAEFSQAVEAMEPGEVSAPVQTQFGWHVIKLEETRQRKPSLDEVREELTAELQQSESAAYLDELTANSDASIAELGDLDLGNQAMMPLYMEMQE